MSIATLEPDRYLAEARREELDSDEALLHAFVTSRDDLACAKVVTRHASLVMGVCRRVLGNEQDAEDAFQATFLVLARKASTLKSAKSLPAWLHKTAHRIWLRARANRARRREQSLETESMLEDRSTLHAAGQSPVGYVSPNAHILANWSLQVMSITSAKFVACAFVIIGVLTVGNSWTVVPAAAEGNGGSTIALQPTPAASPELTFVALLDDDREDGNEREEKRERRDGEDEGERERSRREGERDRESDERPETGGQRRDGDRPREGDARRGGERPRETDQRREEEPRRERFVPQTEREEMLYRMILQLQRDVAALRSAIQSRDGDARRDSDDRDRDEPRRDRDQPRREGDRPRERDGDRPEASREGTRDAQASRTAQWERTKEGKVFKAYDKNSDRTVSLEEWFAMQEGEMTDERRASETRRFNEAEPSGDGKFTVEEFLHWYTKGRFQNKREGERRESDGR